MVCSEYNSPLVYQSKSSIPLQNGQVRIKTRYAGINYAGFNSVQHIIVRYPCM